MLKVRLFYCWNTLPRTTFRYKYKIFVNKVQIETKLYVLTRKHLQILALLFHIWNVYLSQLWVKILNFSFIFSSSKYGFCVRVIGIIKHKIEIAISTPKDAMVAQREKRFNKIWLENLLQECLQDSNFQKSKQFRKQF